MNTFWKTLLLLLLASSYSYGQVTNLTNTPAGGTEYLGWGDSDNTLLQIRQNNTTRMRFSGEDWVGLNGMTENNALRARMILGTNAPNGFSMLNIGRSVNAALYRPWMNIGTSYLGNSDIMYVGLLERPVTGGANNATDAVIAWGCNDDTFGPNFGPDNFRFLFMTPSNISSDAAAEQGREVVRITPEGNFGIGNFSPDGLNEQPTAKLDVDGRTRLRDVPFSEGHVIITGKEATGPNDYDLHALEFSGNADEFLNGEGEWVEVSGGGGDDLDWETDGTDVWTGHGTGGYPGGKAIVGTPSAYFADAKFGIGDPILVGETGSVGQRIRHSANAIPTPAYATGLDILNQVRGGNVVTGLLSNSLGERYNYAGFFTGDGNDPNGALLNGRTWGVYAEAYNARYLVGVDGVVAQGRNMVAVRGTAPVQSNSWAMYANGRQFSTTAAQWTLSDRKLKKNVSDLKNGLELVMGLAPKTYEFRSEEYPGINLSERPQYGMLAQEMAEVLPHSVDDVVIPPVVDKTGQPVTEEVTVKAVDYQALIPILVAATQEQQELIDLQAAHIEEQDARMERQDAQIAELKEMILELYRQTQDDLGNHVPENATHPSLSVEGHTLHTNHPNPFQHSTTISYSLGKAGFAEVKIYDSQGNQVTTLWSALTEKGDYQLVWNASEQAAGIYYCTLEIDGEELVRKMVKL